jgi:hypothetical protein
MLSLLIGCRNFDFQGRLSPFLAWAQTRCRSRIKTGGLWFLDFPRARRLLKNVKHC